MLVVFILAIMACHLARDMIRSVWHAGTWLIKWAFIIIGIWLIIECVLPFLVGGFVIVLGAMAVLWILGKIVDQ